MEASHVVKTINGGEYGTALVLAIFQARGKTISMAIAPRTAKSNRSAHRKMVLARRCDVEDAPLLLDMPTPLKPLGTGGRDQLEGFTLVDSPHKTGFGQAREGKGRSGFASVISQSMLAPAANVLH